MMARTESISSPVFAVNVSSVDDYVAKVEAAGGVVVAPKMEIRVMAFYGLRARRSGHGRRARLSLRTTAPWRVRRTT